MVKKMVVVAMSGGVDSSVAAALLQRDGYEVIGITMCFGLQDIDKRRPSCCGLKGIEDAQRVAHKLGIKHYVLNMNHILQEKVIKNFFAEYLSGRTPNPCVRCNQYLKFEELLKKAKNLGAGYLATGHYARIEKGKRCILKKAKDRFKDQSYFLYRLTQQQMPFILMPLGNMFKEEVRELASDLGLPVANKPGSQEICFIPTDNYRLFLKDRLAQFSKTKIGLKPGPILGLNGDVLGEHKGIAFYTIGQREGLGIAMGYPIHIVNISPKENTITVGRKEDAFSIGLIAGDLSFTDKPVKSAVELNVKIRYNHKDTRSEFIPLPAGKIKVIFKKKQFAVTPGQSVVFYERDKVIGGGIIEGSI